MQRKTAHEARKPVMTIKTRSLRIPKKSLTCSRQHLRSARRRTYDERRHGRKGHEQEFTKKLPIKIEGLVQPVIGDIIILLLLLIFINLHIKLISTMHGPNPIIGMDSYKYHMKVLLSPFYK